MKRYIRSGTELQNLANTSTDPKELEHLATEDDYWIRRGVASNPNTPANVLTQLANDENMFIRGDVAQNPNTPAEVLKQLAKMKEHGVINNPNCPPELLRKYKRGNAYVRMDVAEHPNCPLDLLEYFVNDRDANVRVSVAKNPNCPLNLLLQLADDDDEFVIKRIAKIPKLPENIRKQLFDKLDEVAVAEKNKWPSRASWYNIESDDQFESRWETYLSESEAAVNKELEIFLEPSTQGGSGSMFIYDESGEDNKSFSIDFNEWCNKELRMAANSRSAEQYKEKYRKFVESLINKYWR